MNTKEVMAMIDAITEKRNAKVTWEGADLSDNLKLDVSPREVSFSIAGELFEVADPRTAREIAGALVAWANRKEGVADEGRQAHIITAEFKPKRRNGARDV